MEIKEKSLKTIFWISAIVIILLIISIILQVQDSEISLLIIAAIILLIILEWKIIKKMQLLTGINSKHNWV